MATSTGSVVAFFSTEAQAAEAIDALHSAGFQAREIGAATNTGYGSTAGNYGESYSGTAGPTGTSTGTAAHQAGAKAEGMWDRVKNFFEGGPSNEATGTTGRNIQGGVEPYADERSREVTGGSYGANYDSDYDYEPGDVSHSLAGMSIPEERSRYFENRFSQGHSGVLVTVSASGREQEAERILEQHGGDLGANASNTEYASTSTGNYGTTGTDYNTTASTAANTGTAQGQQRIQLLGEVLRVHKDRVSRGEVRIRKETITEQQTVQVPVTREELVIERMPVSGETRVQGAIGESNEIRIPLSEEHASADKQTVVREEVSVGKRSIENVEQVGGAVRHEELEVDDQTTRENEVARGTEATRNR